MTAGDRPKEEFNRFVEQLNRFASDMQPRLGNNWLASSFAVDVVDDAEEIRVVADLPGFSKDEITIRGDDDTITIEADHEEEVDEEEGSYYRQERTSRSVSRRIALPAEVDVDAASSSYTNGVLNLTLPKKEPESRMKKIEVE